MNSTMHINILDADNHISSNLRRESIDSQACKLFALKIGSKTLNHRNYVCPPCESQAHMKADKRGEKEGKSLGLVLSYDTQLFQSHGCTKTQSVGRLRGYWFDVLVDIDFSSPHTMGAAWHE